MRRAAGLAGAALLLAGAAPIDKIVADLDLSRPFALPAGWRLSATQGPDVPDADAGNDPVPGPIRLCLRSPAGDCDPALAAMLRESIGSGDAYTDPHELRRASLVYPRGANGRPLLLVVAASMHSGDGDQIVGTQLLAHGPGGWTRLFRRATGRNNNEEIRYVDSGILRGDVIEAEPAQHAPFGYWITVDALGPAYAYHEVTRFLSATRYGDGNPLAVIDSEMPNIQRRLGLWHPGRPLPTPAKCAHPHLKAGALWCG